jgi:hypothetical protein
MLSRTCRRKRVQNFSFEMLRTEHKEHILGRPPRVPRAPRPPRAPRCFGADAMTATLPGSISDGPSSNRALQINNTKQKEQGNCVQLIGINDWVRHGRLSSYRSDRIGCGGWFAGRFNASNRTPTRGIPQNSKQVR